MDTTEDLVISPALEADFDWGARLMAGTDPWVTLGRDVARCLVSLHRPASELFVARVGARRLGFILLQAQGVAGSPYVAAVAVAPEARGQGVGSELLRFAERRFPSARHILLCVSDFNTRARQLYERHGYVLVGELKDFAVEGRSELLMHKVLG